MMLTAGLILLCALALLSAVVGGPEPLRLHPGNPHYFLFRGNPTIIVTSGEHYGAVLNLDFDYARYLEALQRDGMNGTRTFVGAYCESDKSFGIVRNTLAPAPGRFICPWARSDVAGYANGGNKFDLTRWDDAYFERLRDFVAMAGRCEVIVEVNLLCPFYGDEQWTLSPMNARNNTNGVGSVGRTEVHTLEKHGGLLAVQERMVRKVVTELREFDNVYYEVMNEPYICAVPMDWQAHIAGVIADAESEFEHRHLISQNVANGKAVVANPDLRVSVFNFHYAWPPETVALNYGLNRVIGDNETGFSGTADFHYRREAWAFILSGGGLYNNLDYSFTVGHEEGSFALPEKQPGGGGATLRRQLRTLAEFMAGFGFVRMRPAPEVIRGGVLAGVSAFALAEVGSQYAVYLCSSGDPTDCAGGELRLDIPAGDYRVQWLNTLTGETGPASQVRHGGGELALTLPPFSQDVALQVVKG